MTPAKQLQASTYRSGWHNGPTPWRCTGSVEQVNGTVLVCTHPVHDEPQPAAVEPSPEPVVPAGAHPSLVVPDLDEAEYHRHPALSSTGAKQLLACPARYRWVRDHGQAPKQVFDFGSAAHRLVLGKGADFSVIEAENWTTKAARAARDEAREQGLIPLLRHELEQAQAMAAVVHEHPTAGALFAPATGAAEQSLFWTDEDTGVEMRARMDWFRPAPDGGRAIIADYKTTGSSADPALVSRTIANFAYHQQADFYLRGVRALGLDADPVFLFVLQEKEPPHPLVVVELDAEALRVGRERNDRALRLFTRCVETGEWPAYSEDVELVSLPPWEITRHDHEENQ